MARSVCRVSAAARADRDDARLLVRPAAGAVGIDAAGVGQRERCQPRHDRAVHPGRHALHAQIPVGAAGGWTEHSAADALARAAARLAGVLPIAADGRDPRAGADRSCPIAVLCGARRAAGRHGIGHAGYRRRRVSGREPRRKTNRPRAWPLMWRPIASAWWRPRPARCFSSPASNMPG